MIAGSNSIDLHSMTKAQLMSYADENGIEGISSRDTKSMIIETIEAAN